MSSNLTMLGSDLLRANAEVCFWSTWYNIEYFHTHSSGVQNMHFNGTLLHGVEAVKVDAALRPNATTNLRESNLGAREQGECILDAAVPLLDSTTQVLHLSPISPPQKPHVLHCRRACRSGSTITRDEYSYFQLQACHAILWVQHA